jgi:hypothetical protein
MLGINGMRKKFFNTLLVRIVILSGVMLPKGALRSRRIFSITAKDPSTTQNSAIAPFCFAQDDILFLFFFLVATIAFPILSTNSLQAQPITIELNNPNAAQLQTDSANWNEAWIELSGISPGEKPDIDDLLVTSGNRTADVLSIDSIGSRFRSRLALSFVLDNSGSMFHAYDSLTNECDSIVKLLPTGAIGQAITFDTRYRDPSHRYTNRSSTFIAENDFTDSLPKLSHFWHFFDTIRSQLTPLYDAIAAAVTDITERRERGDTAHNDVLLVVTDGEDNASRTSIESLEKLVASAHLRLFAINFRTEEDNRLEWLSRKTGGDYFTANTIGDLRTTLQSIGRSMTCQYHIRYRFPTLGPSSGR